MSLRISTGRSNVASVSRSLPLKANGASPSGRPFGSSARTRPISLSLRPARSTFTVSEPAALSAAVSACAGATPPSTTVMDLPCVSLPSSAMNSAPLATSTPSESHSNSTEGAPARKRAIAGSASVRSMVCGFGLSWRSRTRAAPGVSSEMSRPISDSAMIATPRPSVSARAIRSSAVRMRVSQVAAAPQPSSIRSASGAEACEVASGGFHSGPAAAMISSAASVRRSSVSHHGVRAGVSSFGRMSSSSFSEPSFCTRGRGGMRRNSHHSTGRLSSPSSTSGCAKPSGRPIMRRSRGSRRGAG